MYVQDLRTISTHSTVIRTGWGNILVTFLANLRQSNKLSEYTLYMSVLRIPSWRTPCSTLNFSEISPCHFTADWASWCRLLMRVHRLSSTPILKFTHKTLMRHYVKRRLGIQESNVCGCTHVTSNTDELFEYQYCIHGVLGKSSLQVVLLVKNKRFYSGPDNQLQQFSKDWNDRYPPIIPHIEKSMFVIVLVLAKLSQEK